ncbi:hypothetical protein MRB53_039917 [Persea americana]|nr:hypothetical protein MRB53_039917 [Persea americana]
MEAELPANCPYEEVHKILTIEMRALLEPLPLSDDPYSFNAYNISENGEFASYLQLHMMSRPTTAGDSSSGLSTETILERWSAFIYSLPARFPQADARTLLHCISAIGTAALRDITIMAGQSYGHWWVLKIFVDEMALWLAEMGGFLEGDQPNNTIPTLINGDSFYQSPTPGNLDGQNDHGADGDSGHISHASSVAPNDIAPSQLNGNTNGNSFAFQSVKPYQTDTMDTSALHKQSSSSRIPIASRPSSELTKQISMILES